MLKNKIDLIAEDLSKNKEKLENNKFKSGCLIVKKANLWIEDAKNRPIPNMLFSELWYENEVCILFSDTNNGKSVLAVQIGESISRGMPVSGFKLESKPQRVLYMDFELSDKQFENRYSEDYHNHHQFSSNFLRAEIDTELDIPKNYKGVEDYLCNTLEDTVKKYNVSVLIIDNLTFLSSENEKAKDALVLMKTLKKLSKKLNLSILVLAHTPKRDESKPLTKDHLAGSKMLMNFCDSSFVIGTSSQDYSYKYIKQIKQRNTEHLYHSENIILCSIEKTTNFLGFQFISYDEERKHLKTYDTSDLDERDEQMKQLISEGLTNVEIGKRLGLSEAGIRKRRKKLGI
ncbi:AAA family ATPase [Psychroflexus sp. MES1-P1E]|jgi:RecA-family ATPase|uniref:AAA family ATPase n=1 Tax=Psychroflexus sp. MES1-P1E TaxID=2058320 RepID=UPI000C7DD86A|nr:AAA family ATPase [Psychroflexus sp. MES1-P1E]PKG43798.1 LuxR family transcriptional regulator [Psychroflexus sp. MES1-P1E]